MALNLSAIKPAGRLSVLLFFLFLKKQRFFFSSSSSLCFHSVDACDTRAHLHRKDCMILCEKSDRDKFEGLKKHCRLRVQSAIKKEFGSRRTEKKAPKQKESSIHMYAEYKRYYFIDVML